MSDNNNFFSTLSIFPVKRKVQRKCDAHVQNTPSSFIVHGRRIILWNQDTESGPESCRETISYSPFGGHETIVVLGILAAAADAHSLQVL